MCNDSIARIFISYAHEDWGWCKLLIKHLGGLVHQDQAELWSDDKIMAGDRWDETIKAQLDDAQIIVLIITHEFLASNYCNTVELKRAMERESERTVRVYPIIADHCDWQSLPIKKVQCRPIDPESRQLKPLTDWQNTNKPLAAIAAELRKLLGTTPTQLAERRYRFDSARPALTNLPRRNSDWTGREDQMSKLAAAFQADGTASVCSLGGMGGVGKSSLAFEVAHRLGTNAFPDGILQFDLKGIEPEPLSANALMSSVLLEIEPGRQLPEDVAGIYQDQLRGRKMLLILDNAKDAEQVSPMLPPEPVSVLITSRNRIEPEHGTIVDLDLMVPDEAVALLEKELGDRAAGIDLERLAELCGYLPLALHVAAGTIRGSRVRSAQSITDGLAKNSGGDLASVQAQLALSLDVLKADDEALYQRYLMLGVMETGFTAAMAAAVMGVEVLEVEEALETLIDRSLLMMAGDASGSDTADAPRFRLNDLLRELAKDRLDDDTAYGAGLRHAGHCRELLYECRRLYYQGGEGMLEALQLFDRERGHIEAGQRWLSSRWADDDAAATIAAAYPSIAPYVVTLRLHSRDQITWFEMQAEAAQHCGDKHREGNALGNLGLAYARIGEPRHAIEYHEQALAVMREIGDKRAEGQDLGNLGNAYAALGETSRAIEYYQQYLEITREIGDRRGEGTALGNLGTAYAALGETSRAIETYEQALITMREIGDRRGDGTTLANLGKAYATLGEPRRAIEYHEQCLAIAREIGDRRTEGNALWNAVLVHEELDEKDQAIEKAKAAFVIYRALEGPNKPKPERWLRERGIDPDRL